MTHTFAVLEISAVAYAEIRAKLLAVGYAHAVLDLSDGEVIDMHGIAVRAEPAPPKEYNKGGVDLRACLGATPDVRTQELEVEAGRIGEDSEREGFRWRAVLRNASTINVSWLMSANAAAYAGRWVALDCGTLVDSDHDHGELEARCAKLSSVDHFLFVKIPAKAKELEAAIEREQSVRAAYDAAVDELKAATRQHGPRIARVEAAIAAVDAARKELGR